VRIYKVIDGLSYLIIETPVVVVVIPVVEPHTKESNVALRATFEDATVYINPDTNVSGSLSIDENSFNVNTTEKIQGNSSGYKADKTDTFRLDNFISDPYTITFWMLSKYTGTWGGNWKVILEPTMEPRTDYWRLYFHKNAGEIGMAGSGFNGSGITYDQIYNKWTLISVSSSGIITIKCDGVDSNTSLFNSTGNYNTSGGTIEFGGNRSNNPEEPTNIYFDDIRVYNVELSSSDLIDVYNENYVAPPNPVERIVITGGGYSDFDFYYFGTTSESRYLYGLVEWGSTNRFAGKDIWDVKYDPSDGKWYDVGTANPYLWGEDDTVTNLLAFPTDPNMQTLYWYDEAGDTLKFHFENPYYVIPSDSSVAVTELIFNGSDAINLVNIPEDATKVELFRNGIQLDDMVIDGTEAIVQIGTPAS
jgi:hypothetical protein